MNTAARRMPVTPAGHEQRTCEPQLCQRCATCTRLTTMEVRLPMFGWVPCCDRCAKVGA